MKQKIFKLLVALYVVTILYSLYLNLFIDKASQSSAGAVTQLPLALIPIAGGFIGLSVAKTWSGFKSKLGRAISLYSFGLLAWGLGEVGWLIFIYVLGRTEVPYPSPADFMFMFGEIMWYVGSITIAGVIGAQYGIKTSAGIAKAVISSIIAVVISYVLLVIVARHGSLNADGFSLKTFFDFYYPIASALSLTLVSVVYFVSRKFLGGIYKRSLLILFAGFVFLFFGDFLYTYSTLRNIYFNGQWSDMLFTTAMLTLTWGLLRYDSQRLSTSNKLNKRA